MSPAAALPAVGFIGLGDQGLPMAIAIAEAGYPLHEWARHPRLVMAGAHATSRAGPGSRPSADAHHPAGLPRAPGGPTPPYRCKDVSVSLHVPGWGRSCAAGSCLLILFEQGGTHCVYMRSPSGSLHQAGGTGRRRGTFPLVPLRVLNDQLR